MMHPLPRRALLSAVLFAAAAPVAAQTAVDTIPGQFDFGKMWTYEYAPSEYFTETYGFDADAAWFDQVRLSVLRVPGCSASFVSPNGLVATNHHCVRGRIPSVAEPGENLLDTGFYATTLDDERPIPGYYADRLIAAVDVSDEVLSAIDGASTDEERREARTAAIATVEERLRLEHGGDVHVEVRALYHGGRYSAYVFRRFTDVRLVAAAELQLGFFGGDADNFTYPRYALDFAFLRVYDDEGRPFQSDQHLGWSLDGVSEGSVVFVVGNPGPTSRLLTMAQLELSRDVITPLTARALDARLQAMRDFYAADPEAGEAMDLRNLMFSISNSLKAYTGRLDALRDPDIMTRKRRAEEAFVDSILTDPGLREDYGDVIDRIASLQAEKQALADRYGAFRYLGSSIGSATLVRALTVAQLLDAREAGDETQAGVLRRRAEEIGDRPPTLEHALLAIRFADFLRYLGKESGVTQIALNEMNPDEAATALLEATALADRASTREALQRDDLDQDLAVVLARDILPLYASYTNEWDRLSTAEEELAAELGRARFDVFGTAVPPDATSSPRITDGVVRPYEYNGTIAPVYTTFYGMYDHYYSYGPGSDWALPDERWLPVPPQLDLDTPLNFISTADTYGGNSGSPAITPDVEMVGLNFDRNVEGLSRDFIYLPERGRNIMVDVRAITEALDDVYDADRIVEELVTGRLVPTESQADDDVRR